MKEINVINKVSKSPDNTTVEINNIKQTLTSNEESINELKTKVEQSLSLGVSAKNSMVQAINSKKTVSDVSSTDNWGTLSQRVTDIKEGSGNAKVEDVLNGKTFTNSDGVEYTGSIPILSSSTSASEVSIYSNRDVAVRPPKGFCDGTVQIKATSAQLQQAEPNLNPNNIKQGVNVLGVVGNLKEALVMNSGETCRTDFMEGLSYYGSGRASGTSPYEWKSLNSLPRVIPINGVVKHRLGIYTQRNNIVGYEFLFKVVYTDVRSGQVYESENVVTRGNNSYPSDYVSPNLPPSFYRIEFKIKLIDTSDVTAYLFYDTMFFS